MSKTLMRGIPLLLFTLLYGCSDDGEDDPRIITFSADSTQVVRGQAVLLSWEVENAASLSISSADLQLLDNSAQLAGSASTGPLQRAATFTLTAYGEGDDATATVGIEVDTEEVAITRFEASPNPAVLGDSTTLSWSTANAERVSIKIGDMVVYTATRALIDAGRIPSPILTTSPTTFTLLAENAADSKTMEVVVEAEERVFVHAVRARPSVFTDATSEVAFTWRASNVEELKLLANGMEVPNFAPETVESATVAVSLNATTMLELIASGPGGSSRRRTLVGRATSELEPNGTSDLANGFLTGAVIGTASSTDSDFFQIDIPEGASIYAESSNRDGGCAPGVVLALYDSVEEVLGNDDGGEDGGGGTPGCARIDPRRHAFAADLPAGTYFISVETFDDAPAVPYALSVMVETAACGNGILEGTEQCDDANAVEGDGCAPGCTYEAAGDIEAPGGLVYLTVPARSSRFINVLLNRTGQSIEVIARDLAGGCSLDAEVSLRNVELREIEFGDADPNPQDPYCAQLLFPNGGGNLDLVAGPYFLEVVNNGPVSANFEIVATIHNPRCGNGALEMSQGEACDDGNDVGGDRCSPTCTVEGIGSISGPPAEMVFMQSIDPFNEVDLYEVILAEPGYVHAATFVPSVEMCTSGDTIIEVRDEALARVYQTNDDAFNTCSRIAPQSGIDLLLPGRYWVTVASFRPAQDEILPAYALRVRLLSAGCSNALVEPGETCDDGNTVAGDGCGATCEIEGGTFRREVEPNNTADNTANDAMAVRSSTVVLAGAVDPVEDVDVYRIEITGAPASLAAATHSSPGDPRDCFRIDTELTLRDASGAVLAIDDDDAPGNCSAIIPAQDGGARDLAPGVYYLEVRAGFLQRVHLYFLSINLR